MKDEEEFKNIQSSSKCVRLLCSSDDILNHILSEVREIKTCMSSRLTSLELKMSVLIQTCNKISNRLDVIEKNELKNNEEENISSSLDPNEVKSAEIQNEDEKVSSKLKIVPLSSESDYPNGSWLGDPVTNRVRCHIPPHERSWREEASASQPQPDNPDTTGSSSETPSEDSRDDPQPAGSSHCNYQDLENLCRAVDRNLFHINSTCFTPEKMALCLMDNLFRREELAVSNISGRSRWGKKQLNPLLIYGIKAHLKYKFFISEKDWHKICQNMDAKCRFAWKRSQRINNNNQTKTKLKTSNRRVTAKEKNSPDRLPTSEEINFDFENLNHSNMDFNSCAKVMTQSPCELRILNATPAQIANLQESQEIILAEEMLPDSNDAKPIMINNSSEVSMNTVVMDGVVDGLGSDLTIQHDSNHSLDESMDDSKDDRSTHNHHQETLTIHDTQLEEGLQLEVELGHETQVDTDG